MSHLGAVAGGGALVICGGAGGLSADSAAGLILGQNADSLTNVR